MIRKNEETRKVQKLGSSTLALSLPAEWAEKRGIEKGDTLTVRRSKGALSVLSPSISEQETEAVIDADPLDGDTVGRIVTAQYELGRRVITIEATDGRLSADVVEAVYDAESRLMGLGVIEEAPDRISIRCSVDPDDFDLDTLLERLENTARTMRNDVIETFVHDDADLARRAMTREQQANKIFVLLRRLLTTAYRDSAVQTAIGLEDRYSIIGYLSVATNLKSMADDAERLVEIALEIGDRRDEVDERTVQELRELADTVDELSSLSVAAFVDRDYERTMKVNSLFRTIDDDRSRILAEFPEMPTETLLPIHEVLIRLHTSAQYAARNGEIAANVALSEHSKLVELT